MSTPLLSTYANNKHQIKIAIDAGIDHIILDDAKLSMRAFCDDFNMPHFKKISRLAVYARSLKPSIQLSINIDILLHPTDFSDANTRWNGQPPYTELFQLLFDECKKHTLTQFRIQDPGLISFIKTHIPKATIHLALETNNLNHKSMAIYSKWVAHQTVSNQISYDDLMIIRQQLPHASLELQVHGLELTQQSFRRFYSDFSATSKTSIKKSVIDQDHPDKQLTIYDSPHGMVTFAHFDRCLLAHLEKLESLQFDSWLIDCRGESDDYFKAVCDAYKSRNDKMTDLQTLSSRPLTPGFFIENTTDQTMADIASNRHQGTDIVATVLDIQKEHQFTVHLKQPIAIGDDLVIYNPEGKTYPYKVKSIWTLMREPLQSASQKDEFVRLPWRKGLIPGCLVLKGLEKPNMM